MTLPDSSSASQPQCTRIELESESDWLRYRLIRMRTALRFAMVPEVEAILREFIAEGEERLSALEHNEREPLSFWAGKRASTR